MKSAVVGFGSIGARHARILGELGHEVAVVSKRPVTAVTKYQSIGEVIREFRPDYVVVANETAAHFGALKELADARYRGIVLVEKPIFHACLNAPAHRFSALFVGYNLRFHPLVERFRQIAANERVVSASVYVGQNLRTWRERDYRQGYSASQGRGGGVLLDLSHEIDYLLWVLGGWKALVASGGRLSDLEITSDDAYALILNTGRCGLVSLTMNYLHTPGKRTISLVSSRSTYELDLLGGSIAVDGKTENVTVERDQTYREQHQAILGGKREKLCTADEALEVLRVIDAAERSAREGKWVSKI